MRDDRFLTGILIGIAAIVVLSLVLFFTRPQQDANPYPAGSPQAVVHEYTAAVTERDYSRAYALLADAPGKPTEDLFSRFMLEQESSLARTGLEIGEARVDGDTAVLPLTLVRSNGGLFNDLYRETQSGQLVRQNGEWKVSVLPYPYFSWDWYQAVLEKKPGP